MEEWDEAKLKRFLAWKLKKNARVVEEKAPRVDLRAEAAQGAPKMWATWDDAKRKRFLAWELKRKNAAKEALYGKDYAALRSAATSPGMMAMGEAVSHTPVLVVHGKVQKGLAPMSDFIAAAAQVEPKDPNVERLLGQLFHDLKKTSTLRSVEQTKAELRAFIQDKAGAEYAAAPRALSKVCIWGDGKAQDLVDIDQLRVYSVPVPGGNTGEKQVCYDIKKLYAYVVQEAGRFLNTRVERLEELTDAELQKLTEIPQPAHARSKTAGSLNLPEFLTPKDIARIRDWHAAWENLQRMLEQGEIDVDMLRLVHDWIVPTAVVDAEATFARRAARRAYRVGSAAGKALKPLAEPLQRLANWTYSWMEWVVVGNLLASILKPVICFGMHIIVGMSTAGGGFWSMLKGSWGQVMMGQMFASLLSSIVLPFAEKILGWLKNSWIQKLLYVALDALDAVSAVIIPDFQLGTWVKDMLTTLAVLFPDGKGAVTYFLPILALFSTGGVSAAFTAIQVAVGLAKYAHISDAAAHAAQQLLPAGMAEHLQDLLRRVPGVKYLAVKLTQLMSWLGKGTGLAAAAPVLYTTALMLSDAFAKTYAAGKVDLSKLAVLLLVTLPDTLCHMTASSSPMLCKVTRTLGRAGAATQLVRTVIGILQDAWWVFYATRTGDLTASVSSFSGCFAGVQANAVAAAAVKSAKIDAKNAAFRMEKAEKAENAEKARVEYAKTHTPAAQHWGRAAEDAAVAAARAKLSASAHDPKAILAETNPLKLKFMLDQVYSEHAGNSTKLMEALQPFRGNRENPNFKLYFNKRQQDYEKMSAASTIAAAKLAAAAELEAVEKAAAAVAVKSAEIDAKNAAYRSVRKQQAEERTEYAKTHTPAPHWGQAAEEAALAKSAGIEAKNAAYRSVRKQQAEERTEYAKTHTPAPHWGQAAEEAALAKSAGIEAKNAAYRSLRAEKAAEAAAARVEYAKTHTPAAQHWGRAAAEAAIAAARAKLRASAHDPQVILAETDPFKLKFMLDHVYSEQKGNELMEALKPFREKRENPNFKLYFDKRQQDYEKILQQKGSLIT